MTHINTTTSQEGSSVSVTAKLARPFQESFADLVRKSLDRPLAFIVDDQVVAVPVVGSKIIRGSIEIKPSPMVSPEQSARQAKQLAVRLKSWQLAGTFELVAEKTSFKKRSCGFERSGINII